VAGSFDAERGQRLAGRPERDLVGVELALGDDLELRRELDELVARQRREVTAELRELNAAPAALRHGHVCFADRLEPRHGQLDHVELRVARFGDIEPTFDDLDVVEGWRSARATSSSSSRP
jgi:hypothetical protein